MPYLLFMPQGLYGVKHGSLACREIAENNAYSRGKKEGQEYNSGAEYS
jgi:hypothetical protein